MANPPNISPAPSDAITKRDYSNYSSYEVPGSIVYDIIGTKIPDDIPLVIPTVIIKGAISSILGDINSFRIAFKVSRVLNYLSLVSCYIS